jgi:predicted transcriptional regulator
MSYIFYSTFVKKKDMKYRSRADIISMILEIASQGVTKTRIMYKAYLSYAQLNQYISFLTENELIEHETGSELYNLTEKGKRLQHLYKDLEDMISLKKGKEKTLFHNHDMSQVPKI